MHDSLKKHLFECLKEKGLKKNSIQSYLTTLDKIGKLLGTSEKFKSLYWLKKYKVVIDGIEKSNLSTATKHKYYAVILSVIRCTESAPAQIKHYEEQLKTYLDARKERIDSQKMTEKELAGWITQKQIDDVAEILLKNNKLADYIAWSLHTVIPPRRTDYKNMIVTTDNINDKRRNYIIKNKSGFGGFLFYDYKRANGNHQVFNRKFFTDNFGSSGKRLVKILDIYLKNKKEGDPLLNKIYTQPEYSKYIIGISKKLTGKHTTVGILRHIFISNFMQSAPYKAQKNLVADFMSHSNEMQQEYRKRPADDSEEPETKVDYSEIKGIEIKENKNTKD